MNSEIIEVIKEKIRTADLQIGMFVCDLDRPWLETPYPLQGFLIQSESEIQDLMRFCDFVYIDLKQTLELELNNLDASTKPKFSEQDERYVHRVEYGDECPMEEELPTASKEFHRFAENTESVLNILKSGQKLDLKRFRESTQEMVNSVVRNPDAALWLVRLKKSDDYLYLHSIRCSVLAVAFGRQLGLAKRQLKNIAVGAALLDIGKLKLPKTLLKKPGRLNDDEFEMIRDHVRLSLEMIGDDGVSTKEIVEMVATHHERINGRGYPNQLSGTDIPLFGRIAAIVDCYDAISTTRSYAKALSPSEAVKKLYEWRKIDFHPALVEVFIQALGIYPAGSLVELSTGEVGIVMSEYRTRRLRPKIMLILNEKKHLYDEFFSIDLFKETRSKNGEFISIKQSLEPGAFGIDPSDLLLG